MAEETDRTNELVNKAGDYAKQQTIGGLTLLLTTLKKSFTFKGRATRKEFWLFVITAYIINLFLGGIAAGMGKITDVLAIPFAVVLLLLDIFFIFPTISVAVRRLHDLNLTGFWLWYLSPLGLAIVFMVNLLNLDNSCNSVMEKVNKTCTTWVSWLFLPLFWWFGAPIALFLLFLYKGKEEDNDFGPNPY